MKNIDYIVLSWLVAIYVAGVITGAGVVNEYWRGNATVTQCAQYNPVTGDFEWLSDIEVILEELNDN